MSGGTWQYQQNWLMYELAPDLREDTTTDWDGEVVSKDLPKSRRLAADLAEATERVIHDLDWHFAGDTLEDDDELVSRIKTRLSTVLADQAVRERQAVTRCTTADCEEPGTVPGVYDDGDCHERVVYCTGCAADLARGGEFVPDRS